MICKMFQIRNIQSLQMPIAFHQVRHTLVREFRAIGQRETFDAVALGKGHHSAITDIVRQRG